MELGVEFSLPLSLITSSNVTNAVRFLLPYVDTYTYVEITVTVDFNPNYYNKTAYPSYIVFYNNTDSMQERIIISESPSSRTLTKKFFMYLLKTSFVAVYSNTNAYLFSQSLQSIKIKLSENFARKVNFIPLLDAKNYISSLFFSSFKLSKETKYVSMDVCCGSYHDVLGTYNWHSWDPTTGNLIDATLPYTSYSVYSDYLIGGVWQYDYSTVTCPGYC